MGHTQQTYTDGLGRVCSGRADAFYAPDVNALAPLTWPPRQSNKANRFSFTCSLNHWCYLWLFPSFWLFLPSPCCCRFFLSFYIFMFSDDVILSKAAMSVLCLCGHHCSSYWRIQTNRVVESSQLVLSRRRRPTAVSLLSTSVTLAWRQRLKNQRLRGEAATRKKGGKQRKTTKRCQHEWKEFLSGWCCFATEVTDVTWKIAAAAAVSPWWRWWSYRAEARHVLSYVMCFSDFASV